MDYKFFTDRDEIFEANVSIKNATTKNSIARLILETSDINLVFSGKIEGNKCIIPVKKLRGILDEDTKGTVKLELVLEDTYFSPWKSNCIIEKYSKVEINEVKNTVSSKPCVGVDIVSQKHTQTPQKPSVIIENALNQLKYITNRLKMKVIGNNEDTMQLLNEFFKQNDEFVQYKTAILKGFLSKGVK